MVMLPEGAIIYNGAGRPLTPDTNKYNEKVVTLRSPGDDLLHVIYDSVSFEVRPKRSVRAIACLDACVLPVLFFVDEISGNSFQYSEVSFSGVDTLDHESRRKLARGTNLVQPLRDSRIAYLLLTTNFSGLYASRFTPEFLWFHTEVGVGVGFMHRLELYYSLESRGLMGLVDEQTKQAFNASTSIRALKLRLYPYGGFYLLGGYGLVEAAVEDYDAVPIAQPGDYVDPFEHRAAEFHEVLIGIGYSGPGAFIEYEHGLSIPSRIPFGFKSVRYSFGTIKWGINVRIP